jgi:hypothetical protein
MVAEHAVNQDNHMYFKNTTILTKQSGYTNIIIHEIIKVNLHKTFNREESYQFSPAWKTILQTLKQQGECRECYKNTKPSDTTQFR